jgi:hypothetical protein
MSHFTSRDLMHAVEGDLDAFSLLLHQDHATLLKSSSGPGTLIVTPDAVRRVLVALRAGQVSPALVQQWASFVRLGFTSLRNGPIKPVDIDYDPKSEDAIVEVVGRLDEIGDLIDGEVTNDEIERLLAAPAERARD